MIRNVTIEAAPARARRRGRTTGLPIEAVGILYLVVAVLFGLMLVWQPANLANLAHRARELERQVEALKVENHSLKAELSRLESLSYVESVAKTKLGMVEPPQVKTAAVVALDTGDFGASSGAIAEATNRKPEGIMGIVQRIAEIFGGRGVEAGGRK
ncbi:MAG: septum formation initiator family protein [Firmicutes bacterium]|nr:septum formation initiator family protein [Candidatus Fermentithermobacillaceae bacterium]